MRSGPIRFLLLLVVLFASADSGSAQGADLGGKSRYRSERYGFEVKGPATWTKEFDGAKSSGQWIDLVAYRDAKSKARVLVSVQASTHATFKALLDDRKAHYGRIKSIIVDRGPETLSPVMGVRPRGVYVEFQHGSDKSPHRGFTAYYLSGSTLVRLYGTVRADRHADAAGAFGTFGSSLRILARNVTAQKPNFVHDASRISLVFPPNWTVRVPSRDAIAQFRHELVGVSITVYVESGDRDLAQYVRGRIGILKASEVGNLESKGTEPHAQSGEPVATIVYTQSKGEGEGAKRYAYQESCLSGGGDRHVRFVVSGTPKSLPAAREALDAMIASMKFR